MFINIIYRNHTVDLIVWWYNKHCLIWNSRLKDIFSQNLTSFSHLIIGILNSILFCTTSYLPHFFASRTFTRQSFVKNCYEVPLVDKIMSANVYLSLVHSFVMIIQRTELLSNQRHPLCIRALYFIFSKYKIFLSTSYDLY